MGDKKGKLYIVSTPIGNLSDITYRAINTLKEVDLILCEDTRNTSKLLKIYDINNKVLSYHEHNKYEKINEIIEYLLDGKNLAIVSDAGTPLISDPGDALVKEAIYNDIDVIPIPGATAIISALIVSGLDLREFVFIGFLSDDRKDRIKKLKENEFETRTIVFYISPHKFKKHLKDIIDIFGEERNASLSRELTKLHEETVRGSLSTIYEMFKEDIKGEIVLCVSGVDKEKIIKNQMSKWNDLSLKEHMDYYLNLGLNEKEAMKNIAKDRNLNKREVYKTLKQI